MTSAAEPSPNWKTARKCCPDFPQGITRGSGFALNLRPPPANAYEQKAPVVEELRLLALKGMPDKLQHPSQHEQSRSVNPQALHEDARQQEDEREDDQGYAEGVAQPVDGMLVAARILRDPLLVSASAQHWLKIIAGGCGLRHCKEQTRSRSRCCSCSS